jgi:plasmid stabilization system protein ParE
MAGVIWNKRASKQLEELQKHLNLEFGINTTKTFTQRLFKFLDLLVKYPHIGTLENKAADIRGFLLHRHTTILYKVKQDSIFILALFDNRQNPGKKEA